MVTDRFNKIRKEELDGFFSKINISTIWRKVVKKQLRSMDIKDIYDYYDFNYNIDLKAGLVRSDLLNGNYSCSKPLVYRIEKKFGICRHMIIPQPIDALILQVITDAIATDVLSNQPSDNAYYSRDKHSVKLPHEVKEYGYDWIELWKDMQKQIYKFKDERELLVITDLSNYFDSIYIPELRKIITSYVQGNETLLDILFRIIQTITWLPDYLPYSGRNLPTSNLEAVRLLAHSFLFEFDKILKVKSNDSFTRWMDDIVVGVDSRDEAVEVLSSASDVLKSRGLALNMSKTNIYSSKEAEYHFMIDENQYIDSIDFEEAKKPGNLRPISTELLRRFKSHIKNNSSAKYYEKITKRYITSFSKLKSKKLIPMIPSLFDENPGIRNNTLYYLSKLGYSRKNGTVVIEILDKLKIFDDVSLFNICNLVTDWKVPLNGHGDVFLSSIQKKVLEISKTRRTPFDYYCLLWLKSKYDHPDDLYKFIMEYEGIWKSSPFLRRQVTSCMSRLLNYKEDKVTTFLRRQISTSESQVVSVATSILEWKQTKSIEGKVNLYLFSDSPYQQETYPLQKFLVLCTFLNSDTYRNDVEIKKRIVSYIKDPYYKKWIEFQYNIK